MVYALPLAVPLLHIPQLLAFQMLLQPQDECGMRENRI
jgi:hypothetical protein